MRKHRLPYILAGAALAAALLAGCTNERLENEMAYRKIGINSMQSGDYEGAVAAFNSALSQCVGEIGELEIDICYYKAAAQYAGGDTEGALATYQAMLDYDDKNGDAYYLRGCLKLQNGDSESALSDFNNAVKYNSDDFELYVGIYENLAAHNMVSEGEEYLNQAFEIKGNSADQLTWRGRIYYLLGQYENAQTELTAALEKDSSRANLYLAQVYEAQGDSANAEKYYQAYVQTGTADSVAMNALAEIEMEKGNYTAALDYINQGLAMEEVTNQKDLMSNQIIACEYTGDFAKAWSVVQEYVTLYPEDEAAQREYIFLKNRQTQESTEEVQELQGSLEETTESTGSTESAGSTESTGSTESDTSAQ